MAYVFETPQLGAPAIASHIAADATSNAPVNRPWKLGDIARAVDPTYGAGEFIYLKGLDNTVVGSWVTYNLDDWSTTLAVADAVGPVAVAMAACVTGEYGWYQISGKAVGKVLSGFADNANVYLTSTAGSVDDTVVAGDYVYGAKGASAIDTPSTGLAEFEISRPFVKNGLDDATS
jgi:hypothetical protein